MAGREVEEVNVQWGAARSGKFLISWASALSPP